MNTTKAGYLKIGLVVVLAIVFLAAIGNSVRSFSGSPARPPGHTAKAAVSAPLQTPAEATSGTQGASTWPAFDFAQIEAYDPFEPVLTAAERPAAAATAGAKPRGTGEGASADGASAEATSADAEREFPARIQVVYQRGNRSAVIIDSHTLRPGDALEGGGRILEIDQQGVMVEVAKP